MRNKDDSISLLGLSTQALFAMTVANEVAKEHGQELVITSGSEAVRHSRTSLHFSGNAFDMRTRFWSKMEQIQIQKEIQERLGRHFDVVLESDHIHIEYQPKCRV